MNGYKDLEVYKRSYVAAKAIYELTEGIPQQERYGITDQLRRAALSIPQNIAEGYGKQDGDRELARFLRMARGSCAEIAVLLDFASDMGYISQETRAKAADENEQIGKMLTRFIQRLKTN